jgi:cell division septation protein DedD
MAFWNNSPEPEVPTTLAQAQQQLENTQYALSQSRRRLLGAVVLLALACALIPWMLDSTPRPWGEDVILRMPKTEQPYQSKPTEANVLDAKANDAAVSAVPGNPAPAATPALLAPSSPATKAATGSKP